MGRFFVSRRTYDDLEQYSRGLADDLSREERRRSEAESTLLCETTSRLKAQNGLDAAVKSTQVAQSQVKILESRNAAMTLELERLRRVMQQACALLTARAPCEAELMTIEELERKLARKEADD